MFLADSGTHSVPVSTHTHTRTRTHTHAHAHTHLHTCTHTQVPRCTVAVGSTQQHRQREREREGARETEHRDCVPSLLLCKAIWQDFSRTFAPPASRRGLGDGWFMRHLNASMERGLISVRHCCEMFCFGFFQMWWEPSWQRPLLLQYGRRRRSRSLLVSLYVWGGGGGGGGGGVCLGACQAAPPTTPPPPPTPHTHKHLHHFPLFGGPLVL